MNGSVEERPSFSMEDHVVSKGWMLIYGSKRKHAINLYRNRLANENLIPVYYKLIPPPQFSRFLQKAVSI